MLCALKYEYLLGCASLHRTWLLLKLKIPNMLPHNLILVPPNQKRKSCSDSQSIIKFAKPLRMADARRERLANADRPRLKTSAVETSAAETDDRAISVLLLPCYNESGAETVSVMLSVHSALTGHASCYIKLTDTEKELAVKVVDAHIANGRPKNESIKAVKKMHPRFANISKSSIARWRKKGLSAPGDTSQTGMKKAGRPKLISQEHRDRIKKKVCSLLSASYMHSLWLFECVVGFACLLTIGNAVCRITMCTV